MSESACDHIVGLADRYSEGYLLDFSALVEDGPHAHSLERFTFCPTCGERIDYAPVEAAQAAREAKWEKEREQAAEQRKLLRWPI